MLRPLGLCLLVTAFGCAAPVVDVVVVDDGPDEGEGEGEEGEGEEGEGEEGEGEGDSGVVDVGHVRELRGAWVATVFGINWPTNPGASAASKEQELRDLLHTLADRGTNAVFFQVRPESDALYASSLEPWSRFLTGTQGENPGFDPLAVAIDVAHSRGIELHAWVNPYRGMTSTTPARADNHVSIALASAAITHDGGIWMNPASTAVRSHVVAVVEDIVTNYAVDGVHFDDYFYPYPGGGEFPDQADFDAYASAGGAAGKSQWRRDNVNALIADVSDAIVALRPSVRFGVSPFGIYRPGIPEGIVGLDAYEDISCDAVTWLNSDWVDYVAPQLYWPTTQEPQAFGTLLPWWASLPDGDGRFVVAGMNLTELGGSDWPVSEYESQLAIVRAHGVNNDVDGGAKGVILYHADNLVADTLGVGTTFQTALWPTRALPPPVAIDPRVPALPVVVKDGAVAHVTVDASAKGFVVYKDAGAGFVVDAIVSGRVGGVDLGDGVDVDVVVTAVGDNDRESRGVRVR